MQIPINKDIEEAYRNEALQGFTIRELIYLAVAAVVIVGVTVIIYFKTGLSPDTCIYIGVPFGLPIIMGGFKRFQGLTAFGYLKEIIYDYQSRKLAYDADELPEGYHEFTMQSSNKQSRKRWWNR